MPLVFMLLVFLLYCALIFLMKYKTEIIKIRKKKLKKNMIQNFILMNGYGIFVWASFMITLL